MRYYSTATASTSTSFGYSNGFTITYRIAPPDPPYPDAAVDAVMEAVSTLELELPITRAQVKLARKRLAREHHPDMGGSLEVMQMINAAADLLEGCR